MGSSSSKNVELTQTVEFVTDSLIQSTISAGCKVGSTSSQSNVLEIDGTAYNNLLSGCFQSCAQPGAPSDCRMQCQSAVPTIKNIDMTNRFSFSGACSVDNTQLSQIQSDLANKMDAKAKNSEDVVAGTLKSLGNAMTGGDTSDNVMQSNDAKFHQITRRVVTATLINDLVNASQQGNKLTIVVAPMDAGNIIMTNQADIVMKAALANEDVSTAVAKMSNDQKSSTENKDQFAVLQSITDMVNSQGGMVLFIVLGVVAVVGLVMYFMFR